MNIPTAHCGDGLNAKIVSMTFFLSNAPRSFVFIPLIFTQEFYKCLTGKILHLSKTTFEKIPKEDLHLHAIMPKIT